MDWKYFSLEQVNNAAGEGVNVWDEPTGYQGRSLLAFKAAEAARRQGDDEFRRLHMALLKARHEQGRQPLDQELIEQVAGEAALDIGRLRADMQQPGLLRALARDHTHAVERLGVFGTPTLVFDGQLPIYLKMRPAPPEDEAVSVFEDLRALVTQRRYIGEVKRPTPPQGESS